MTLCMQSIMYASFVKVHCVILLRPTKIMQNYYINIKFLPFVKFSKAFHKNLTRLSFSEISSYCTMKTTTSNETNFFLMRLMYYSVMTQANLAHMSLL